MVNKKERPFLVGDRVLAPSPDLNSSSILEGIITGKDRRKVAVNFERNDSDTWTYDTTELSFTDKT